MKDSEKSADWIAAMLAKNPVKDLGDGNFRTTIARASFPHIFEKSDPIPPNTEGNWGINLVFPPAADLGLLTGAARSTALEKWGDKAGAMKLKSPFKPQAEMAQRYAGYNDSGVYVIATARQNRPSVFDTKLLPITDEDRVYPGVWVIGIIRPFTYDKAVNKGVAFGLQGIMVVADDTMLGAGRLNPQAAFGGVAIDDSFDAGAAFGDAPAAGADPLFTA